jgi:hypothetical protein
VNANRKAAVRRRVSAICCSLPDLVAADPDRYLIPDCLGPRGWVEPRLDRGRIDWDEVTELVEDSYRLVAPKRLVARLGE